jgi:phenylpyruvate tautomerase PptA (4-oxalocrotonate tautomerase family)
LPSIPRKDRFTIRNIWAFLVQKMLFFVQITMSTGRKPQQKRKLYKRIAEILAASPGLKPQDSAINLVEVAWEYWSSGNGEAQYMDS